MSVALGTRIGPYEVISIIGAGGMGEVYRATDTNLKRPVAIKVLRESIAAERERLARFQREAEVLASLNHPNIAAIYGLERSNSTTALVMELIEGPTLADRIADGPIPLDEAVSIARQIAEALDAAHEQGIIHRDLKPANVKVRSDGIVKVLDFGLAKALEPTSAGSTDAYASPTLTSPAMITRIGVILGTAAYMSPEQAKGRAADKRSDVWAFGCVLYEMLTGSRAFEGEDVSDTIAAVLRGEPDWTALPATVSPAIVALLRGCLDKDRRRRIGDLSTARFIIDHGGKLATAAALPPLSRIRRAASTLVAVVAVAGIAAYATWRLTRVQAPSAQLARFTIALPTGERFTNAGVHVVALSADGSRLAYTANGRLYLRTMDQLEATPIRGTEGEVDMAGRGPFFSPDGRWIGFWQDRQLKKVSITGGAPIVLCAAENPWGVNWTTDNTILFGQSALGAGSGAAGIWRVSSEGGNPQHIVTVEADQVADSPQMLPGGGAVLFTLVRRGDWDAAQIVAQSLDSGKRQVVVEHGIDVRYVPTGHLVYVRDGTLFAAPFDVTTLAVTGAAVPLVEDVAQQGPTAHFAISSHGALVYVPRDALEGPQRARTLVWIDRQGREAAIKAPPRPYFYPRLSPDGSRVALEIRDQEHDIWILDLARETLTRLTIGPTVEGYGVWTPDGRDVIYSSGEFGGPNTPRSLFRRRADGTGTIEQLTRGSVAQSPSTVAPDGTALIFREQMPRRLGTGQGMDLVLLPLAGERRPRPLLQTPFDELNAEVSRDGHWLAYQSNESGRDEIYVRPFPNVDGGKRTISTNGGRQPLWARNGQELFYESTGALMSVPVRIGSTLEAGTPRKLIDFPYVPRTAQEGIGRMYDVSPDGQRFLMIKEIKAPDGRPPFARMIFVQNWFEELKRLAPAK
jgi:eukaryotic-like serine/threonine-protein kinase